MPKQRDEPMLSLVNLPEPSTIEIDTLFLVYEQYIRPHLEFAVPAWSPWLASDRQVHKKVQKRAVKMTSELTASTYEGRLAELDLLSLEACRVKYDLVQTFKQHFGSGSGSTAFCRIRTHLNPRSGSRFGSGSTSISFLGTGSGSGST